MSCLVVVTVLTGAVQSLRSLQHDRETRRPHRPTPAALGLPRAHALAPLSPTLLPRSHLHRQRRGRSRKRPSTVTSDLAESFERSDPTVLLPPHRTPLLRHDTHLRRRPGRFTRRARPTAPVLPDSRCVPTSFDLPYSNQ